MWGSITRGYFTLFLLFLLRNDCKSDESAELNYRLPNVTIPHSYEIKLVPEIIEDNVVHHGEAKIGVKVLEETLTVILHSESLSIDESFTSLVDSNGIINRPMTHTYNCVCSFLVLEFDEPIAVGIYTLNLKFASITISDGISMIQRHDEHDEKAWTIFSGLSKSRRTIFPCWDEPHLRATFKLWIKHSPNYKATSNMPVHHTYRDNDGERWTNFDVTPPMPTYLVTFVIHNFECIREGNETINLCGAKDVLSSLEYARDESKRALIFLEKHMKFKSNLSKIDLLAVPYSYHNDMSSARGLIIYREKNVKYEPFNYPASAKADMALTVVEGLIQQWIKNLVPIYLDRWNYAWLASGLSTYLKYYVVDKLHPDWREMDKFRVDLATNLAFKVYDSDDYIPLELDSLDGSPCHKFLLTSNLWGAAGFHMLSNIVSEDVLIAGITKFVNNNQYHTVTIDSLWDAIQSVYDMKKKESSGELSIKEVIKLWHEQRGYPLVNVTRDYETGKVIITQQSSVANETHSRWWIPINFATTSNPNFAVTSPTHWLKPEEESLIIDGVDKDDWIIVNIQLTGLYRVDYDEINWKRIVEYMNSENYLKIHAQNRAQLLSDLYYMMRLNRQKITTLFDLFKYLSREVDYIPWSQAMDIVSGLRNTIFDSRESYLKEGDMISNFFLNLAGKLFRKFNFGSDYDLDMKYKPFYDSLDNRTKKFVTVEKALEKNFPDGYMDEDFFTKRYRPKVLSFVCELGNSLCLDSALVKLRANIDNPTKNPISGNLKSWVNCFGAIGNEDYLLSMLTGLSSTTYLDYLACSPDKVVLWAYVRRVLIGELEASKCQLYSAIRGLIKNTRQHHGTFSRSLHHFISHFDTIFLFFKDYPREENIAVNATIYIGPLLKDYIYRIPTIDELHQIAHRVLKDVGLMVPFIEDYINQQTTRILWSDKMSPIIREWYYNNVHTSQVLGGGHLLGWEPKL